MDMGVVDNADDCVARAMVAMMDSKSAANPDGAGWLIRAEIYIQEA